MGQFGTKATESNAAGSGEPLQTREAARPLRRSLNHSCCKRSELCLPASKRRIQHTSEVGRAQGVRMTELLRKKQDAQHAVLRPASTLCAAAAKLFLVIMILQQHLCEAALRPLPLMPLRNFLVVVKQVAQSFKHCSSFACSVQILCRLWATF